MEGDEPRSAVAAARAWLRAGLTAGPRPASELRQVAAQGIDQNALYAARKAEGITMAKKRRLHGRWLWMLAPSGEDDGERARDRARELGTRPAPEKFAKFANFTVSRPRTPLDAASYQRGHTLPGHPEDTRDLVVVLIAGARQLEMGDPSSVLPTSDFRPPTPDSEGLARFTAITRHGL